MYHGVSQCDSNYSLIKQNSEKLDSSNALLFGGDVGDLDARGAAHRREIAAMQLYQVMYMHACTHVCVCVREREHHHV